MSSSKLWLSLLLMLLLPMANAGQQLDKIAAIVNDEIITTREMVAKTDVVLSNLQDAHAALPPRKEIEKQVLQKIILDTIQLQLAKAQAISADSTSVNQEIADMAKKEGYTVAKYKDHIAQKLKISFAEFREQLQNELTIMLLQQRELMHEVKLSTSDIDSYLNSPAGQDHSGTEYRIGHILLLAPDNPTPQSLRNVEDKAQQVLQELQQGKDFSKVAISKSAGAHALQGGDLGWRKLNAMPTLFVKHVPSMHVQEVIGPIRSASGFHILKLLGKRVGKSEDYVETEVRQIFIKPSINTSVQQVKANLQELRSQVLRGADFAKLAEGKSEELKTAAKGGSLGWITEKDVVPEFYQAINKLAVGDVSEPFETSLGWHLVQITGKRNQNSSMEAARNMAANVLRQRKFSEKLDAWLTRIRDDAKVEILI